jgi:hypothetical protein
MITPMTIPVAIITPYHLTSNPKIENATGFKRPPLSDNLFFIINIIPQKKLFSISAPSLCYYS